MTSLYGCHNQPRPVAGAVTHQAQKGWQYAEVLTAVPYEGPRHEETRIPVMVDIKHVMTTDCQYTLTTRDRRCAGCDHEFKPTDAPAAQDHGQN